MSDGGNITFENLFSTYADQSLRLDQYRAASNALITQFIPALSSMSDRMPSIETINSITSDETIDSMLRRFVYVSAKTTVMFNSRFNTANSYYGQLQHDNAFFSLRVFLTFQYSLFEEYVREVTKLLITKSMIRPEVMIGLSKNRFRISYIIEAMEKEKIYKRTPFNHVLPYGQMVEIGIQDLYAIKNHRNNFAHWNEGARLNFSNPDAYYERCMWVLRQFAGNIRWMSETEGMLQI